MKQILRNRSLVIIAVAESVSGIGSWVTTMALFAILVFQGGGGVVQTSGLFFAMLGPMLVFSTPAGWLCDRFDRKYLMMASELLSGLAVLGIIFTTRIELLYLLLALEATFSTIMSPARQSVIPSLVLEEEFTRANAFLQQLAGIIKIGAPFFAGLVLAVMAPREAMVLDVISFVFSAALLSRLPNLPPARKVAPQPEGAEPVESIPEPKESLLGTLRGLPRLRLLFISAFLLVITLMSFDVLASVFTRDVLHGDTAFFGVLVSVVGLGTVAASVFLFASKRQRDPWTDIILSLVLLGCLPATLCIASYTSGLALARVLVVLGCLLGGAGNGLLLVQGSTLMQLLSPREMLGRMSGLFQATLVGGQIIALFLTPLLVPAFLSAGQYLGIAAVLIMLLVVSTALTLRRTAPSRGVA